MEEAGSQVKNVAVRKSKKIITMPDRITDRALSFPWTSVMMSLMLKSTGIRNIATLARRGNVPIVVMGNNLDPISSAATRQNI